MRNVAEHPSRSMGFLSRYHDRELPDPERLAFERHAAACPECTAAVAEYEAILALYRESGTEPADALLASRISRRIDAELRRRPPVRFLALEIDLLWASVAAIGLVAAIALFAVLGRERGPAVVAENDRVAMVRPEPSSAPGPAPQAASPENPSVRQTTSSGPPSRPAFAPEPAPEAREGAPGGVAGGAVGGVEGSGEKGVPTAEPAPPLRAESRDTAAPSVPMVAAPSAAVEAPLRVGGRVTAPVEIRRSEPSLPDAVRRSLAASPVVVEAVISAEGNVVSTRVVRSNPAADRDVLEALRRWKYRPATLDEKPVSVYLTVTFRGE